MAAPHADGDVISQRATKNLMCRNLPSLAEQVEHECLETVVLVDVVERKMCPRKAGHVASDQPACEAVDSLWVGAPMGLSEADSSVVALGDEDLLLNVVELNSPCRNVAGGGAMERTVALARVDRVWPRWHLD